MKACADKGAVIGMVALGYFVGPVPGGDLERLLGQNWLRLFEDTIG